MLSSQIIKAEECAAIVLLLASFLGVGCSTTTHGFVALPPDLPGVLAHEKYTQIATEFVRKHYPDVDLSECVCKPPVAEQRAVQKGRQPEEVLVVILNKTSRSAIVVIMECDGAVLRSHVAPYL